MELPRRALVIGSSGTVGAALAAELRDRGARVDTLSRSEDGLDLADEASIEAAVAALDPGEIDWIVVATGILAVDGVDPERTMRRLDPAVMARAYAVNAIGPALLVKHLADRLPRDRDGVFAALSARIGSIDDNRLGGWMSYRASKAALNQLWRCASIEIRRKRKQACVVTLHPGTVESALTREYARGRFTATASESASQLVDVLVGLTPADSGGLFDYSGARIPF